MSDKRFREVVTDKKVSFRKETVKFLCADCGEYSEASIDEFKNKVVVDENVLSYVAKMRAWNCCNESNEPLDSFPERPNDFRLEKAEK